MSNCRAKGLNITDGQEGRPLRNIWRRHYGESPPSPRDHKHFPCDRLGATYDACTSSVHTTPSRSVWYTAVEKNADFSKGYSDCSKTSTDMKQLTALICIRRLYLLNTVCKHLISFFSNYADNMVCTVGDRKLSTLWLVVISSFKDDTGKIVMNGE